MRQINKDVKIIKELCCAMVTKIYSRNFSAICDLQNEETVDYNLLENTNGTDNLYGIEVISAMSGNMCKESIINLSGSRDKVMNVIKYLYENSVKIESFRDIVSDIFNK